MDFMDNVTVLGEAPETLLFQVDVVSVKNLPAELAKDVRVKVYMSQRVGGQGATAWQFLGQTKAWCPKRWKPQKRSHANSHGSLPQKQIHSTQAVDGINPEYLIPDPRHRNQSGDKKLINPYFLCPYKVDERGRDYQLKFEVSSNNQIVGVAKSGTWVSVTHQDTLNSMLIDDDGVAMNGYQALKTLDEPLWKDDELTTVRLQAKVLCNTIYTLLPAAAAPAAAVPAVPAVPAAAVPVAPGPQGTETNPVIGVLVRTLPSSEGPNAEMLREYENVICTAFLKKPVPLQKLLTQPALMPRIHPSGSLCYLKAVKHLRNPKQA